MKGTQEVASCHLSAAETAVDRYGGLKVVEGCPFGKDGFKNGKKILHCLRLKPEHPTDADALPWGEDYRDFGGRRLPSAVQGQQDRLLPHHRAAGGRKRTRGGMGGDGGR